MTVVFCYFAYLALTLTATIWVAHTLRSNGRIFLIAAFHGDERLAESVNHLLVVGFYLINVGYVALSLRTSGQIDTLRGAVEIVCDKAGFVLVVLGVMHFGNVYVFNRLRKRGEADFRPPFPPDQQTAYRPE